MSEKMIECIDLVYSYDGEEKVSNAVDNVSFEVKAGEFIVVLGRNGSGKSTLAKHMNSLLLPGGGKIYVDGMNTLDLDNTWDIRTTAGMVFQNPDNQIVATIVEEDVAFGPENLGVAPLEIRARVDEALKIVDMYDYANDINYYSNFETDYKYTYSMNYDHKGVLAQARTVDFLNEDHFMKSVTSINENDLSEGTLPTELFEIAIYSENTDILGTTLDCYFTAENIWGNKQHYFAKCKVTGILKEECDQIYFSGKLCSMLTVCLSNNEYIIRYDTNGEGLGFKGLLSAIPVIGEGLEYTQIRATNELIMTTSLHPIGKAGLSVNLYDKYGASYQTSDHDMEIMPDFNENNTGDFFELNEQFFNELFSQGSPQASMYIDDYVYMDDVLSDLKDQGYEAISTYRTAAIKYIPVKVNERITMITTCVLILLFLSIFEVLIVGSFLRIKSNNFEVLKSMGMNYKTAKKITYYELPIYALAASIIVICTALVDCTFGRGYLVDLFKYFKLDSIIIYFVYNIFLAIMAAFAFNRYLHRKMKKELI